jgi:hypothetical protein
LRGGDRVGEGETVTGSGPDAPGKGGGGGLCEGREAESHTATHTDVMMAAVRWDMWLHMTPHIIGTFHRQYITLCDIYCMYLLHCIVLYRIVFYCITLHYVMLCEWDQWPHMTPHIADAHARSHPRTHTRIPDDAHACMPSLAATSPGLSPATPRVLQPETKTGGGVGWGGVGGGPASEEHENVTIPRSSLRVRVEGLVQRDSGQEGGATGLETLTMWVNAGQGTHGQGEGVGDDAGVGGVGVGNDVAGGRWSELIAGIAQALDFRLTASAERCDPSLGGGQRWQDGEGDGVGPGGGRRGRETMGGGGQGGWGAAASFVMVQEGRSTGRDRHDSKPPGRGGVRGVLWTV